MSDCDVSRMEEWMAQPDLREPTRQQKCAELARAMGWRESHKSFGQRRFENENGQVILASDWPDPFTDHEACHALMLWLAEHRRNGSGKANWIIFVKTIIPESKYLPTVFDIAEAFLTADLAIRAEAAWLSIQKVKDVI